MNTRTRIRTSLLAAALAALLVACGGGDTATDTTGEAETEEDGAPEAPSDLSEAEVSFLTDMVPHHGQAVEMSALVPERAEHDELDELAEQITASQDAEIDEMNGLLEAAGEEPVDAGSGMGHSMDDSGSGMSMPGMMSPEEMGELGALSGNEFDLAFIDAMSAHHQGAVEMSNEVLGTDPSPAITELAEGIIAEQEAELEQMAEWREEWAA